MAANFLRGLLKRLVGAFFAVNCAKRLDLTSELTSALI